MTPARKPSSRADQVRSRRAKDIKERVVIATDNIARPDRYTPIVTRTENSDTTPIFVKANKKAKRKLYLPLLGGAELKLPALPVLKPGWRLASAALFLLAGLGLYAIWEMPYFRVATVNVVGGNRITPDEVMNIAPLKGQRMLTIIPNQIATVVQNSFPVLSSVEVSTGIPNSITIHLNERQPVLAWQQDGTTRWISADGIAFEPYGDAGDIVTVSAAGNPPTGKTNLTVARQEQPKTLASIILKKEVGEADPEKITATPPKSFIDPSLIPSIQAIGSQVPEGVTLTYNPKYGLGWQDPQGWMVYFGMNPDDMPAKLNMYRTIVDKLKAQGVTPSLISMEYLYAPYYRNKD